MKFANMDQPENTFLIHIWKCVEDSTR